MPIEVIVSFALSLVACLFSFYVLICTNRAKKAAEDAKERSFDAWRSTSKTLESVRAYGSNAINLLPAGRERRRIETRVLLGKLDKIQMDVPYSGYGRSENVPEQEKLIWDKAFSRIREAAEEWSEGSDVAE